MAPKRIIADSDDEDDDFSPIKPAAETPIHDPRLDMEPLSPHHQPTSPIIRQPSSLAALNIQNDTSDTTDPSFFARVYDEQQGKALQQSHLIENIVRLSQKASASSGDVSLPAKGNGKGKKVVANASSPATDITSPMLLTKPPPRKSQLAQMSDATELTTPKKISKKDEWDIPSSDEEGVGPTKRLVRASNSTADDSGKFYVAPSNLSASQKRQYRRVQISDSHSGGTPIPGSAGQMQPPSNHKSSGATTVAVSTPSRYASSGPRPPWETEQTTDVGKESVAVDLTLSSPDAIAVGEVAPVEDESPMRRSSMKRKRPVIRDDDDELGHDGVYEDPLSDLDPEYGLNGRLQSKKHKQQAKSLTETPAAEPKKRGRKKKQPVVEDPVPVEEVQDREPLSTTDPIPESAAQTPAEKPKKKRGRPRKSEAPKVDEIQDESPAATKQSGKTAAAQPVPPAEVSVEDGSTTMEDSWKQSAAETSTKPEDIQLESATKKSLTRSVSPLKEADRNTLVRSQSTISESDSMVLSSVLVQDKSVSKSITPSQAGKALYRVGLSKKSRIAPLLKIIRK
ncbi:hypothetical protein SCARD494_03084 [Seiridium cardinale]